MNLKNIRQIVLLCITLLFIGIINTKPTLAFEVKLPCLGKNCDETITIPNGRPVYALLVSGFHQNRNFELFHWYNFAKCLQAKGAYVHYAWWNNLLAPYMERPLHNVNSVPSTGPVPWWELIGMEFNSKAIPNEDYQFQEDAEKLLRAIHEHNPDAAIILVGHSMGGDAIARLAHRIGGEVFIDLLAPIDPVGNRSEVPGLVTPFADWVFTRYRATHIDRFFLPDRRDFRSKVGYLYHRWQNEYMPPFDYECPCWWCISCDWNKEYYFVYDGPIQTSIRGNSTNVQFGVRTSLNSGYDANPANMGGANDGHGEVVGFRGVKPLTSDSWPLALEAGDDWPSRDKEEDHNDKEDEVRIKRVKYLKEWENDPYFIEKIKMAPPKNKEKLKKYCKNKNIRLDSDYCTYCMVSGDLCVILETAVSLPPTGALQVTLGPSEAVSAGAQWRIDGVNWHDSDKTVSNLVVGTHNLEFKEVSGWITPKNQQVTINENQTTVINGMYEGDPSSDSGGRCFISNMI